MYHEVARGDFGDFAKYVVTPEMFRRQMAVLSRMGYTPIAMDALAAARRGDAPLPRRPVVITFDDGFGGVIEHAVPVLRTHGFAATFYLVSDFVGDRSRWLRAERGLEIALFDWPVARSLAAENFEIGSHSATHPHLPRLDPTAMRSELQRSRAAIGDAIGHSIDHLAYPFGAYDDHVASVAAEIGYTTSCSVRIGLSGPEDDALALHRVPVNGRDTIFDFVSVLLTGKRPNELASGARRRVTRALQRKKVP